MSLDDSGTNVLIMRLKCGHLITSGFAKRYAENGFKCTKCGKDGGGVSDIVIVAFANETPDEEDEHKEDETPKEEIPVEEEDPKD